MLFTIRCISVSEFAVIPGCVVSLCGQCLASAKIHANYSTASQTFWAERLQLFREFYSEIGLT